jgi:hypothetical protein
MCTVNHIKFYSSRQHLIHVSVITDHSQTFIYMVFKTQNANEISQILRVCTVF